MQHFLQGINDYVRCLNCAVFVAAMIAGSIWTVSRRICSIATTNVFVGFLQRGSVIVKVKGLRSTTRTEGNRHGRNLLALLSNSRRSNSQHFVDLFI